MKEKVLPRNIPSRYERYMGLAFMYSALSKDPRTQHGAQVVTVNNEPLGWGYNGPPKQMKDEDINWDRPDKYPYMVHSEPNAIDHSDSEKMEGAVLFVTGKPCAPCMLDIVKAGIKTVVYYDDACMHDAGSMCAAKDDVQFEGTTDDIAYRGGVRLDRFQGDLSWLKKWVDRLEDRGVFALESQT